MFQCVALPYSRQKFFVDCILLQITGFITPAANDGLDFFRLFRCGLYGLGYKSRDGVQISGGVGVDHLPDGFHLTAFALRLISRLNNRLLQIRAAVWHMPHPIQQTGECFLRLFLRCFQLLQGVQSALIAADVGEKAVQLPGGLGNKLSRRLIGGQLPALADALQRRIVLAPGHVVQERSIELPG